MLGRGLENTEGDGILGTRGACNQLVSIQSLGFLQPRLGHKPQGVLVLRKLPLRPPPPFSKCATDCRGHGGRNRVMLGPLLG